MKSEIFAQNYIFFRFPFNYIIVLFPQIIGLIFATFFIPAGEISNFELDLIQSKQYDIIDSYLFAIKMANVLILAFVICYQWSNMQNNGSYGYWMIQGVEKRDFYIIIVVRFLAVICISELLGILALLYTNGLYLTPVTFIKLVLVIISYNLLSIMIAIFFGNTINNPELATLSYMILLGINLLVNNDKSTFWHKIFQGDMHYFSDSFWISFFFSLGLGLLLFFTTLKNHLAKDIEL